MDNKHSHQYRKQRHARWQACSFLSPLHVIRGVINYAVLFALCVVSNTSPAAEPQPLALFFNQPGQNWEADSLSIGNGHIGATLLGGVITDTIQFNEKTLWTGGPGRQKEYTHGFPATTQTYAEKISQVQQLLDQQQKLAPDTVVSILGHKQPDYGSYQSFGELKLNFPGEHLQYSNYKRDLNLESAVASVSYINNGINYLREYFVSYPDNALVIRLSADKPASINVNAHFSLPPNRQFQYQTINADTLLVSGSLDDNGLKFAAALAINADGGKHTIDANGQVQIKQADTVVIKLTAATDYKLAHPNYRQSTNQAIIDENTLNHLETSTYDDLLERHLKDYQALFSRVTLNIGQAELYATDQMLSDYASCNIKCKRSLEHLYYQYGRYLLIASSRNGSLPANLQGIWNKDIVAPWNADYHLNINLQMNYWLADVTNLAETLPPLFDFIDNLTIPGQQAAEKLFNSSGWVVFLNTNPWGSIGLIDWPTAFWQPEAAAWISLHYFDHFQFSQDRSFLANRAYPVLKLAAQFWLDNLITDPHTGRLVVSPSYSPEHGDFTSGASMSQQIVFDLFSKTRIAARLVDDPAMADSLSQALEHLDPGLRVGSWGQIQEWQQDWDNSQNHHRHISHLYALHPGDQISVQQTPELAKAAQHTLNARGDNGTGWSKAWKINFWARLQQGDRALKLLQEQLVASTLPNLWSNHPPFQIDGNFGATAGMSEMLIQSNVSEIHLLPALPAAWHTGNVQGLRARGDYTVSMYWSDSNLKKMILATGQNGEVSIRNTAFKHPVTLLNNNKPVRYTSPESGVIRFSSLANQEYVVLVND